MAIFSIRYRFHHTVCCAHFIFMDTVVADAKLVNQDPFDLTNKLIISHLCNFGESAPIHEAIRLAPRNGTQLVCCS
jgi:hypothetical protein